MCRCAVNVSRLCIVQMCSECQQVVHRAVSVSRLCIVQMCSDVRLLASMKEVEEPFEKDQIGESSSRACHVLVTFVSMLSHIAQSFCSAIDRFKVFSGPFLKRFALCYEPIVLSVCLSVMLVYCRQTVGWIKMKLSVQVGLGPGHIVLDGHPAPPSLKGRAPPPQYSAHICCGQTVGYIKMPLGMEVGLSPGDFLLHGDPALSPKRGRSPTNFQPMSIAAKWLHGSRCHLVWR